MMETAMARGFRPPARGAGAETAPRRWWQRLIGPAASMVMLAAVIYHFRTLDLAAVRASFHQSAVFWLVFAGYYLAMPVSEWVMYRRLWQVPARAFGAFVRKRISNEILLGYAGEAYFWVWARHNAHGRGAPFGAIKDVTILSAAVGNAATLFMVLATAPMFRSLELGVGTGTIVCSALVLLALSAGMFLFRSRLFTLPNRELWIIAGLHMARIVATSVLGAVMWHLLLPTVAIGWWLLLATLRLLVSRLPFLPNKDIVFAGLVAFLVGSDPRIGAVMTLLATLLLAAHLLLAAVLGAGDLARRGRPA